MAPPDVTNTDPDDTNADTTTQDRNWRQLEKAKEKAVEEANRWKQAAMKMAATQARLDPSKRIVQKLLEEYASDLNDPDDVTPDALTDFAKEWGYEVAAPDATSDSTTTSDDEPSEVEETLDTSQSRADQLASRSTAPKPADAFEKQLNEAAQKGDWESVFAMQINDDIGDIG